MADQGERLPAATGRRAGAEASGGAEQAARRRLATARAWTRARTLQSKMLSPEMSAEPAWDILLALYLAHGEYRMLSVSDAVNQSNVPPTTGLRWLMRLEAAGLVVRRFDPRDRRRIFVQIAPETIDSLETIFDRIAEGDTRAGLSRVYFQP